MLKTNCLDLLRIVLSFSLHSILSSSSFFIVTFHNQSQTVYNDNQVKGIMAVETDNLNYTQYTSIREHNYFLVTKKAAKNQKGV